jgi:succinyl-CoA synthetase beta subunit
VILQAALAAVRVVPMKLHEYQAKRLLADYHIAVPAGQPAVTGREAVKAAELLGGRVVVKAQVHSGGRGKAGGIAVAETPAEVKKVSSRLLGTSLVTAQTDAKGLPIQAVLVEKSVVATREMYLGLLVDPSRKQLVFLASARGGMEIEQLATNHPDELATVVIDPLTGLLPYQARALARALALTGPHAVQAAQFMRALYRLFVEKDCSLVEINPLVVTDTGELLALDAKITIDDNALFRQPEMAALRDDSQIDPLEQEAARAGVSYVKMDGNIGCLVNGAGLAMATMDLIAMLGGRPANFLDVGGAADEQRICKAIELLLDDADVKVAWINIFGGILRCDLVARALLRVTGERHPSIPFVVRLQGTNASEARDLLASGPMTLMLEPDLGRAARLAVAATGAPSRRQGGPAS